MSHYTIHGALGSPYSMKVRAALRAKRIVHVWKMTSTETRGEIFKHVKAPVIPVIQRTDGTWTNDSTPFLLELEDKGEGRPLLPTDPSLRFACLLIEDMADEWLTKAMFHYRWFYEADADQLSKWLIYDNMPTAGDATIAQAAAAIAERQISRMPLVGCTPETAPVIEGSAKRLLGILDDLAKGPQRFIFGGQVALADVALYGQLWQLRTDPTPAAMMRAEFPYAFRWLEHVDDASGFEGGWSDGLSDAAEALLAMAGDTYLPFLKANADAIEAGEEAFNLDIEGRSYSQGVFKYQAKCLSALRGRWAALDETARGDLSAHIGANAGILS